MSDIQVAQLSRQHEIDIAVDLKGYTQNERSRIFAYRAAPLQVSYLGYPATTGLNAIDFRFTDALADPPAFLP